MTKDPFTVIFFLVQLPRKKLYFLLKAKKQQFDNTEQVSESNLAEMLEWNIRLEI